MLEIGEVSVGLQVITWAVCMCVCRWQASTGGGVVYLTRVSDDHGLHTAVLPLVRRAQSITHRFLCTYMCACVRTHQCVTVICL